MKQDLIFLPLWFLSAPVLLVLHFAAIIFLPYPFSEINILAAAVILALLITESGAVVWWALALFCLLDWYTVGPFGIVLSAGTLATLLLIWLYRGLLTNRGVWSVALLTAVFVVLFRILYTGGLLMVHGYDRLGILSPLWWSAVVELLATTVFVSFAYFILALIVPALKVTHTKRTNLYARD